MNGAESLVHTLLGSGVDTCFSNPGTSEMHFVAALDRIPGMHCVLGLFEGVVTGAADGYARVAGKPAATLLHCGPGLGNGLANLHNARRASTPMVNIVGDQATYHRPNDPPLTADTEGWARGASGWVRTATEAASVGADAAAAVQAATIAPGQIATLILPSDTSWNEGGVVAAALPRLPTPLVAPNQVDEAAAILRRGGDGVVLLLGGDTLGEAGLALAHRIAAATGCALFADAAPKIARGQGRVALQRVPYVVDAAVQAMAGTKQLILCGARKPVTFFAYPGKPTSSIPATAEIHVLARKEQDGVEALARLADTLHAPKVAAPALGARCEPGRGALTPELFAATVGALIPEGAIIADEFDHLRTGSWRLHKGLAAARLVEPERRRDRRRHADGDRRSRRGGDGWRRQASDQPAGGRLGDVHSPVAVDPGPRAPGRHHGVALEPQIPNPAGRTGQCGREPGPHRP